MAKYELEIDHRNKHTTEEPYFAVGGKVYDKKHRKELLFEIARIMKKVQDNATVQRHIGEYRGLKILVEPGTKKGSRQFTISG